MVFFSRQMFVFFAHFLVFPHTRGSQDISDNLRPWAMLEPAHLFDRCAPLMLHITASLVWFASNTSLLSTQDPSWNFMMRVASSASWLAGMAILRLSSNGLGAAVQSFPQLMWALFTRFPLPVLALGAFSALPGQLLKAKAVGGTRGFAGMSKLLLLNMCHTVGTLWAQRAGRQLTLSIGSEIHSDWVLPAELAWSMRLLMVLVVLAVGVVYTHGVYTVMKASPALVCEWSDLRVSSVVLQRGPRLLQSAQELLSLFRPTPPKQHAQQQQQQEAKQADTSLMDRLVSWGQLHKMLLATYDVGRLLQGRERMELALQLNATLRNVISDINIGATSLEVILHSTEAPPAVPVATARSGLARTGSGAPQRDTTARAVLRGACLPCIMLKKFFGVFLGAGGRLIGGPRAGRLLRSLWEPQTPTVSTTAAVIHIDPITAPASEAAQDVLLGVQVDCQLGRLLDVGRELRSLAHVQSVQLQSTHSSVFSSDVKYTVPLAVITRKGLWSSFESTRMSVQQLLHNTQRLSQINAAVNAASVELLQEELDLAGESLRPALHRLNASMANLQQAAEALVVDAQHTRLRALIGWSPASEVFVDAMLECMVALVALKVSPETKVGGDGGAVEKAAGDGDAAGATAAGDGDAAGATAAGDGDAAAADKETTAAVAAAEHDSNKRHAVFVAASLKLANALSSLTQSVLLSAVSGMHTAKGSKNMQHEALTSLGMGLLMFALQAMLFPDHVRKLALPGGGGNDTAPAESSGDVNATASAAAL